MTMMIKMIFSCPMYVALTANNDDDYDDNDDDDDDDDDYDLL